MARTKPNDKKKNNKVAETSEQALSTNKGEAKD